MIMFNFYCCFLNCVHFSDNTKFLSHLLEGDLVLSIGTIRSGWYERRWSEQPWSKCPNQTAVNPPQIKPPGTTCIIVIVIESFYSFATNKVCRKTKNMQECTLQKFARVCIAKIMENYTLQKLCRSIHCMLWGSGVSARLWLCRSSI